MRPLLVLLAAALMALSTGASAQNPPRGGDGPPSASQPQRSARPADDPVAMIPESDREMKAAVAEALRTLPLFWSMYDTDAEVRRTGKLKVGFVTPGDGREHMWLHDIRRTNGKITGVLENTPDAPMSIRKGDTVTIDPAEISDWGYARGGRLYGNYTTRAMLKYLEPALVEQLRALLSDRPLEGSDI